MPSSTNLKSLVITASNSLTRLLTLLKPRKTIPCATNSHHITYLRKQNFIAATSLVRTVSLSSRVQITRFSMRWICKEKNYTSITIQKASEKFCLQMKNLVKLGGFSLLLQNSDEVVMHRYVFLNKSKNNVKRYK